MLHYLYKLATSVKLGKNKAARFLWKFCMCDLLQEKQSSNIAFFNSIRKLTVFNDFLSMGNKYIYTYKHISKEWKISFCRLVRSNHYKSLNLLCTYTIWLFAALAQINTSNIQQIIIIYVDILLADGILPTSLDRQIKWIEAFQSRIMSASIGFSFLIGIIYSIIYSIVSFFWLYFYRSIQYGDN